MSEVTVPVELVVVDFSLKEHYKECVRKFLKTVVVVDDRAYKSTPRPNAVGIEAPTNPLDELALPHVPATVHVSQVAELPVAEANDDGFGMPVEDKDHELDGPGLVRLFAGHGIVCSIIQPELTMELHTIVEEIKTIAHAADVLVLDWELRPGDHTASLAAIEDIVALDRLNGGRLRFIVIYTASNQRGVKRELKRVFPNGLLKTEGNLMRVDHACIVVLNKPSVANANGVPLNLLPDKIFDLHSELSAGVLPAAALSAIGTIRNHTHQILGQFKRHLDAAFITHRALIPKSDDAEAHLVELVADSFHHLMLSEGVRTHLSDKICVERLRELKNADVTDEASSIIESCLSSFRSDKLAAISQALQIAPDEKHKQKRIMERFYPSSAEAETARKEMAFLHDFTRTHLLKLSAEHPPRLTLGTIVAIDAGQNYEFYLCIQPRCDSIRFQNVRTFPLMKLTVGSDSPNIHLEWHGAQRSLSVSEKLYDMFVFGFGASGHSTQAVTAVFDEVCSKWFFETDASRRLYWVGDLRREKAQRLVSKIASRLHLPGINDFEPTRVD